MFLLLSLLLFTVSLGWRYHDYTLFVSQKKIFTDADVLMQYTKKRAGKTYEVLKLETSEGLTFYTTSKKALENLEGKNVSVLLFPKRVTFPDYLATPYIPSVLLRTHHAEALRMRLSDTIAKQHETAWMRELFGALFLALPVPKDLRERVTLLGVNHLLALSGFHMGLLWLILYSLLSQLYKPFQRLFPWRHRLLDVGALTLLFLGGYLLLTGSPPSLLRAYFMVVVGWIALLLGIELLSFTFLGVCVVMLTALFPALLLSIGFWLSVGGVFFIYLFLKWTVAWPKWAIFIGLNLWVYLSMLPVVHAIFGTFSFYQFASPLLTMLFTLFYPLWMALHLLGIGGVTDRWIVALLHWPEAGASADVTTPLWFLSLFLAVALAAVRWRIALYMQFGLSLGWLFYLVQQIA
ncbi:competence protein [Hydrogenimonas cancrithermarum]|uniref:Competence protein n=1 Tax=Hydrogenimonas cancrithermarum TaxID=2993563 RepID=A0ABN6WUC3_9BACT|nr:competence protein [Hydrogenimonas cancrithermarum]